MRYQTDKNTTFQRCLGEVATFFGGFGFRIENRPIFVPMKMLILVPKVTGRVMYVFDLMLRQLLGLDFDLTTDAESFKAYTGPKLHYGSQRLDDEPFVKSEEMLLSVMCMSSISARWIMRARWRLSRFLATGICCLSMRLLLRFSWFHAMRSISRRCATNTGVSAQSRVGCLRTECFTSR